MQWLSIYGDSKSSLFQILLYSGQRFMSLVLCCWLEVWVLFIKLLWGWRRSPRYRPVWPSRPCWDAQEASSAAAPGPRKCLASVFVFIPAFPSPHLPFISLLSPPPHVSFRCPHSLWDWHCFQHFQLFCLRAFQTSGTGTPLRTLNTGHISLLAPNVTLSCLYICSHSVTLSFTLFSLPLALSLASLFHCLGWLQKREIGRREDTAREREQEQERKEGRVQALK